MISFSKQFTGLKQPGSKYSKAVQENRSPKFLWSAVARYRFGIFACLGT